MMWEHYLDGTLVSSPADFSEAEQVLRRDFTKRIVAVEYRGSVTFTADGHALLRSLFVQGAGCGIVKYEAYTMCGGVRILAIRANIIMADCDWNLNRCEVTCSLVDDGIGARISNNVKVPISPTSVVTKNGDPNATVPVVPLEVFNNSGVYQVPTRTAYDYFACMVHALRYITDDNVTVVSTWYNGLPDDERFAILSGYQLRTGSQVAPEDERVRYTWDELFSEISKKYNLWLYVTRDTLGAPVINIEPEADTYLQQVGTSHAWQDNLEQSIDRDQLWASVKVGSTSGISNREATLPLPFLVLQGFSEEAFQFDGVCNTEVELDLVSQWGICTNLINRVAIGGNDEFDDDPFIVQYNRTNNRATIGNYFSSVALYNEALLNINVLNRYPLPSQVGGGFGPVGDNFRASALSFGATVTVPTASITVGTAVLQLFDDDVNPPNENPNGTWDPVLSRYTVPVQGFYQFRVLHIWEVLTNTFPLNVVGIKKGAVSRIVFRRFDAFNVLQSSQTFTRRGVLDPFQTTPVGKYNHEAIAGFVLNPGDYVNVAIAFDTTQQAFGGGVIEMRTRPGTFILTQFVANGGGSITSADSDAARIVTLQYDRLVDASTWASFTADPRQAVTVAPDGSAFRLGHIKEASCKLQTGEASWTLVATRDQI